MIRRLKSPQIYISEVTFHLGHILDYHIQSLSLPLISFLWGLIDPIGTVRVGKDWAYGPISSPRIKAYPRTINKGRDENCFIGRGKEYL